MSVTGVTQDKQTVRREQIARAIEPYASCYTAAWQLALQAADRVIASEANATGAASAGPGGRTLHQGRAHPSPDQSWIIPNPAAHAAAGGNSPSKAFTIRSPALPSPPADMEGAVEAEREACAKIADAVATFADSSFDEHRDKISVAGQMIASAIRSRATAAVTALQRAGRGDPATFAPLTRKGEGESASDPGSGAGSPVPDGWQIVPKKADERQIAAGVVAQMECPSLGDQLARAVYDAMLEAAPILADERGAK